MTDSLTGARDQPPVLTRQTLYEMVWSEPLTKVAVRFSLSDRGLAKICARANVPVPGRGHWQRKAFGKPVVQQRLPRAPTGDDGERISFPVQRTPAPAGTADRHTVIEVRTTLAGAHPFVQQTKSQLHRASVGRYGLLTQPSVGILDVRVTRKVLDRALRIFDGLIGGLVERGYDVLCQVEEPRTSVVIGDLTIPIRLEEYVTIAERPPRAPAPIGGWHTKTYDHTPSGKLGFHIEDYEVRQVRRTWREGRRPLERMLDRVVTGLEVAAAAKREERARWEAYHREVEESRRREEEIRQKRLAEERRVRALEQDLAALVRCRRIEEYVEAVRTRAIAQGVSVESGSPLGDWLAWAAEHATKTDPVARLQPLGALQATQEG